MILLFLIVNAIAAFFQGITGFGQALIATPLSLTFLSKGTVLTAMILAGTILSLFLSIKIKEPLRKDLFWPLFAGSLVGMPIGLAILKLLAVRELRIFVGGLSILSAIIILFEKLHIAQPRRVAPFVGFVCGVLQTSAGMAGAPIVLLLSGSSLPKHVMRKLMVVFFFWISIVTLPLFIAGKVVTAQGLLFGICAVPVVLFFGYLGNKAADRLPNRHYRLVALLTICATGLYAIIAGLT